MQLHVGHSELGLKIVSFVANPPGQRLSFRKRRSRMVSVFSAGRDDR